MDSIMAKGLISDLLNKIFDAFTKSLGELFSDESGTNDSSDSFEKVKVDGKDKTKYTFRQEHVEPIVTEDGKPLKENDAVAEITTIIIWPDDQPITRKEAMSLVANKNTWRNADNLSLEMSFKNSNKVSKSGLNQSQVKSEIDRYIDKHKLRTASTKRISSLVIIFTEGTYANSSKKLNFTLQKITSDKDISIELTKINANYDIREAMDDVDAIISDDTFVDQLPDDAEISYESVSDESDYDVNECESFNTDECVQQMINITLQTMSEVQLMKVTASGDEYDQLVQACETIQYQLDVVLIALSDTLYDDNAKGISDINIYIEPSLYEESNKVNKLYEKMNIFLDCLNVVIVNCSPGNQSKLSYCIQSIEDAIRIASKKSE